LTDAAGYTFTYTYDREGRVLAAFDAEGRQIFRNTYDDCGRVISQEGGTPGRVTRFAYYEDPAAGTVVRPQRPHEDLHPRRLVPAA
ncbi:RHS repeat protein, partial [Ammonifex thiophilus]|uniref:RHS repeat protein n=1 Tax=Ammonifex thiophilus TaxID=444093 RepID=UPI001402102A